MCPRPLVPCVLCVLPRLVPWELPCCLVSRRSSSYFFSVSWVPPSPAYYFNKYKVIHYLPICLWFSAFSTCLHHTIKSKTHNRLPGCLPGPSSPGTLLNLTFTTFPFLIYVKQSNVVYYPSIVFMDIAPLFCSHIYDLQDVKLLTVRRFWFIFRCVLRFTAFIVLLSEIILQSCWLFVGVRTNLGLRCTRDNNDHLVCISN